MTLIPCPICGDDAEPADCPDRSGWDDHGVCCIGNCQVCSADLADQAAAESRFDGRWS